MNNQMQNHTKIERIFSGLLFLVAVGMIVMAWGYTAPIAYDPIGPRPYPLLILSLMAIGTAVLALRPARFMDRIEYGWTKPIIKNLVLCGLALLLYGILFEKLGYIISTTLMAWSVGLLFGGHKVKTLLSSVVMAILTYLLFEKALDVTLPSGLLSFLGL